MPRDTCRWILAMSSASLVLRQQFSPLESFHPGWFTLWTLKRKEEESSAYYINVGSLVYRSRPNSNLASFHKAFSSQPKSLIFSPLSPARHELRALKIFIHLFEGMWIGVGKIHFYCAVKILSILSPPHCSLNSLQCVWHLVCEISLPLSVFTSQNLSPPSSLWGFSFLSLPVIANLYFVYQCSLSVDRLFAFTSLCLAHYLGSHYKELAWELTQEVRVLPHEKWK